VRKGEERGERRGWGYGGGGAVKWLAKMAMCGVFGE
jgi:hypothetical protein